MVRTRVKIGDRIFNVPQPYAMKSFALQQRIIPVFSRVVAVIANVVRFLPDDGGVIDVEKLLDTLDLEKILPAAMPHIGLIFSEMPRNELQELTAELLGDATCHVQEGVDVPLFGGPAGGNAFDTMMQGRTVDIWRLLLHALGVWYPDFFALAARAGARRAAENGSKGSGTSTPPGPAPGS